MITNCKNCGLPIFHGAAGYVGAQCRCGFGATSHYDNNALADLLKERDQLKADNEAYKKLHEWLKAENERLKEEVRSWVIRIQQRGLEMDELSDERDTLRKQLSEARELLFKSMAYIPSGYYLSDSIDAWLERNKP